MAALNADLARVASILVGEMISITVFTDHDEDSGSPSIQGSLSRAIAEAF